MSTATDLLFDPQSVSDEEARKCVSNMPVGAFIAFAGALLVRKREAAMPEWLATELLRRCALLHAVVTSLPKCGYCNETTATGTIGLGMYCDRCAEVMNAAAEPEYAKSRKLRDFVYAGAVRALSGHAKVAV